MSKMKEYKGKTVGDLKKLISEKREALRHFRFGSTHSKTKNVKMGKTLRKEIARIMTEISLKNKTEK